MQQVVESFLFISLLVRTSYRIQGCYSRVAIKNKADYHILSEQ